LRHQPRIVDHHIDAPVSYRRAGKFLHLAAIRDIHLHGHGPAAARGDVARQGLNAILPLAPRTTLAPCAERIRALSERSRRRRDSSLSDRLALEC
jgi:hypothetical protein